jgi:hypothetical protein
MELHHPCQTYGRRKRRLEVKTVRNAVLIGGLAIVASVLSRGQELETPT